MSAALAKLAVNLERKPELTAHLLRRSSTAAMADDPESNKTLVEHTAELLHRAFTTCLTDRTLGGPGSNRNGKPEGKKVAIYSFANLVLKLLFQVSNCRYAFQRSASGPMADQIIVSKNTSCDSSLYQCRSAFPALKCVPCPTACHILILPWPLLFFKQSLLPRTDGLGGGISSMPCSMCETTYSHPYISHQRKSHPRALSYRQVASATRGFKPRAEILADMSCNRQRGYSRIQSQFEQPSQSLVSGQRALPSSTEPM